MKYKYMGRNMDVTQGMKNVAEKKLERLEKFFTPDTTVMVTFRTEGRNYIVEVTIPVKGAAIRAEVSTDDAYKGLDEVMDKLERQIVRYRKKLIDKAKQDKTLSSDYFAAVAGEEPDEKLAIQRVKKIAMKPMDPEEACLQMELLGHNFFMFKNAETGAVKVVYKMCIRDSPKGTESAERWDKRAAYGDSHTR